MLDDPESVGLRPSTLTWVNRLLEADERIVRVEDLHGGITAEMRKLTVVSSDGGTRQLVLRSYVSPYFLERADGLLKREATALSSLTASTVQAPTLLGVDLTGAQCEYPSLLMTHLPGTVILDDEGLETRIPLLAQQLVAIHRTQPATRPPLFETLTTAESVVVPPCAEATTWATAIDVIRQPRPSYNGHFLHRDFQPGNVLFDLSPQSPAEARLVGVVDWAGTSWGPVDLDVAHTCTNLALLHGPAWGLRFARAYEEAGGLLAEDPRERLYWLVRDGLAASEEVQQVSQPWRDAGRTELTTPLVERRLDAYLTGLLNTLR